MHQDEWDEAERHYHECGYAIFRNVISADLLAEAEEHLAFLARRFPEVRPEHYHHPLMRDDAFWVRLVSDERLLDIAERFVGPNIASFTSHYISKPARTGHAVLNHQDGAYWKLEPMRGVTLWLAIDHSTPENGCLRVYPSTHRNPLEALRLRSDVENMLYSETAIETSDNDAVDLVLAPGDVSVHNPFIVHGSRANTSEQRRCGLDIGYIPTSTKVTSEGLYSDPILLRGTAVPGVNSYRAWPLLDGAKTISFAGDSTWNARARLANANNAARAGSGDEVDALAATQHMIARLQAGTTAK